MPRKSVAKTTLVCLVLAIVILISLMIFAGVFDRFFGIRGAEAGNVAWRKTKKRIFGHIAEKSESDFTDSDRFVRSDGSSMTRL